MATRHDELRGPRCHPDVELRLQAVRSGSGRRLIAASQVPAAIAERYLAADSRG